ncbi:MAG: signal peptide peptidase SppA [Chitinophagaceae bacterium]|nr:signal peptide peptidase SppA [Chitinophagaceae bacterium]
MSFWKIFFGSLLAFVIGTFLLLFIIIAFFAAIATSFSSVETVSIKSNSILSLDLSYEIPEQTTYIPFQGFSFSDFKPAVAPGVYDIMKNIEKAKTDPSIKGIYLNFGYIGLGMANTDQIRNALIDFKKSGKFIVAYSELYSEKAYYLCSVADKVIVNPKGIVEFNGMSAQYMFFKGLLDKVGVQAQVFYDGKFKSATEPFRLDSMSKENELMTLTLLNDVHGKVMKNIAESRKIGIGQLDSINNNLLVQNASDAKKYGIVDEVWFDDQVRDYLKEQLKLDEKDKIEMVSLVKYLSVPGKKEEVSLETDKIALLFADGDIVDGKGDDDNIGSEKYVKQLRKLREDDKVKAIVFRVNSPGGSALASDIIAREVQLAAAKKPVVVSMGDYAASGGYYISAYATKIVAQPNTLTGSIGVFGIYPNMQKLFEDKLGIHFDGVQTGKYSDFGDASRPMREDEKLIVQRGVDSIYHDFKATVVKGRKISEVLVDTIAQGRVWTGSQALAFGLVDTLGGLEDAINVAVRLAKSSNYRLVEFPEVDKDMFELISMFREGKENSAIREKLGPFYSVYEQMQLLSQMHGVQARMPFVVEIE